MIADLGNYLIVDTRTYLAQRRGGLEVRSDPNPAVLREIHLREAELLRSTFTTSTFESFTEMLRRCEDRAAPAPTDLAGRDLPLIMSQRGLADARIRFEGAEATFGIGRTDRADLERARQRVLDGALAHDALFGELLADFDGFAALPLRVPRLNPVHATDGALLGYLLQAPEPISPVLIGLPDTVPHGFTGHTSFEIVLADGAALPTGWLCSSDGSSVFIHAIAAEIGLSNAVPDASRRVATAEAAGSAIRVRRRRDLHDDEAAESAFDHLHDRPYTLARGSRADIVVEIPLA